MNVPDDWHCHWVTCPDCGGRYHASDGDCGCVDEKEDRQIEALCRAIYELAEVVAHQVDVPAPNVVVLDKVLSWTCGYHEGHENTSKARTEARATLVDLMRLVAAQAQVRGLEIWATTPGGSTWTVEVLEGE